MGGMSKRRDRVRPSESWLSPDEGAARMLLEGHIWFDVVDAESDWTAYRILVLPDGLRGGPKLQEQLRQYVAAGGKVLACGEAGLSGDESATEQIDTGAQVGSWSTSNPCYVQPRAGWSAGSRWLR